MIILHDFEQLDLAEGFKAIQKEQYELFAKNNCEHMNRNTTKN